MKKLKCLCFFLILISCKNISQHSNIQSASLPQEGLTYEFIQSKVKGCENKLTQQNPDFNTIREQILNYKHWGIVSIPIAESIIRKHIKSLDEPYKDSAYVLFMNVFYNAANPFSDSLESKYADVLKKVDKGINNAEVKDFKKCLDVCGLTLLMTEGIYYVDAKYDYFYNLFYGRVSPAMDEFLKIRKTEMKEGYSEDAGLLISFKDLYNRVIRWEDFMTKYPHSFLKNDAENFYDSYLSVLLTGMDNSRTFDMDTEKLLPEMKLLYEKIMNKNDSRNTTKIISEYYALLKANDFKQPENIKEFLKEKGLYCMLGVQPETR